MSMRVFRYGKHAFSFEREKDINFPFENCKKLFFVCRRGFVFPFCKRERSTFFFTKKKKVAKKKLASLLLDLLSSMETLSPKARQTLRKRVTSDTVFSSNPPEGFERLNGSLSS
jgi:hypothetical protein